METQTSPNSTSRRSITVLLVDDVDASRLTTKWFLGSFGFMVECARNAEEALSLFDPNTHDLVLTDNSMPGMTGTEMAHVIKLRSRSTPILMYTGLAPEDCSAVDSVIEKPVHLLTLKDAIESLLGDK